MKLLKHQGSLLWLGLLLSLGALFGLSLAIGSVTIPLPDVVKILLGDTSAKPSWRTIIWTFRLPKAIVATLVGAALSASGLQMQTLFQNPLAGPYVLGVSGGASLGVALVVLAGEVLGTGWAIQAISGAGAISIVAAACLGAMSAMAVVILAARYVSNSITLLVVGLLFGYATSALVNILLYLSTPQQIQTYIAWTFGSFASVTWNQIPGFAIVISIGLVGSMLLAKSLNVLLLGTTQAQTLGLNLGRTRFGIIVNVSLLAGVVTAFCGPIAFLGVAVPHLGRSLLRSTNHWQLLPAVMLLGSCLALMADLIAQLPGTQTVIPINSVTALIGTPIITWVILRRRNR